MKEIKEKINYIYKAGLENMVVLVTTSVNGKNYVMTSGTFAEVSHEPPMLLVSICPERYTHDRIIERGAFCINILSIKQKNMAKLCGSSSGRDIDKFEKFKIPFQLGELKLPFIQGCLANIGCNIVAAHMHGDHTIFVGEMAEAVVFGERTQRHLLLSDMATKLPRPLFTLARKIQFLHWLKRQMKNQ